MPLTPPKRTNTELITVFLFDFNDKTGKVDPHPIKRNIEQQYFTDFFPDIFIRPIQYFPCQSLENVPQDYKTTDFLNYLQGCKYLCRKESGKIEETLELNKAHAILFKLSERNYAPAVNLMSAAYRSGALKLTASNMMALARLTTAAKQGLAAAIYQIGRSYEFGLLGLRKNLNKAFYYYQRAAERGFSQAQYIVGWAYANRGLNRDLNEKLAVKYYQHALDRQNTEALYQIAFALEMGTLGLSKDLTSAIYYYEKAAIQGHIFSIIRMRCFYEDRQKTEANGTALDPVHTTKKELDKKRTHASNDESHPKRLRIKQMSLLNR